MVSSYYIHARHHKRHHTRGHFLKFIIDSVAGILGWNFCAANRLFPILTRRRIIIKRDRER